ncbi:hypothetical protein ACIPRL_29490 [Streptomyces sp. NPDC090085]|uniref:hypothetical protein n=1 Tax=Streptomyces sp. NPDC090085 TaxID=3365943 RepID=UPI0037F14802
MDGQDGGTHAVTVKRGKDGVRYTEPMPVCPECQADFRDKKQFIVGIDHGRRPSSGQTVVPWDIALFEDEGH